MDLYESLRRAERGRAQSKHNAKVFPTGRAREHARQFGDFDCCHCRLRVSAEPLLAGVHNRNHCPYCLWSKHVDLLEAGDRLAACKAPMRPVGLTCKHTRKRYAPAQPGELMLVHRCAACGAVALNRIAADDSPERLWEVFAASLLQPPQVSADIALLGPAEQALVQARLFGTR
jgi:hypothetical protein